MNLKYISYFLVGSLMFLSLSSCDDLLDGFLTQENPNEVTTDVFWDNLSDCNKGLTAVYNSFKNQAIYQFCAENNRSDLTWPGVWPKYPQTSNVFYLHTFNDATSEIGAKWAALYTGIFRANQVIEGLEGIKGKCTSENDIKKWQLIMGQARFFRGLFHFYLNTSFNKGNIPILDIVPKNESEFFIPCSSSGKVKEFYRIDLEYAESILPVKGATEGSTREDWLSKNGDLGRVTSGAASAVLGMSYLYDSEYAKAKEYFQKIVDNTSYRLADCADNFTTQNEFNSESILEINYTHEFNTEYDVYSQTILSNILNMYIAPGTCGGWGPTVFPSYWLMREYTYEPVDKRDPRNKVYLKTDSHGDILHRNQMNMEQTISNGKTFYSYPILNVDDMCYYLKKIEVDQNGNPVIADKEDLPANTYTALSMGIGQAKAFKAQPVDGTWEVYYDEEGKPYRYRNHSIRSSYSIIMPTEEDLDYYTYNQSMEVWAYSNSYAAFRKYSNWDTRKTEKDSPKNMDSEINYRVIRLADIYLMYAECLIEGGTNEAGVSEALKYINRVRQRGGTILIGSENDALAEYKHVYTYQDTPDLETGEVDNSFYHHSDDPQVISTAKQVMEHLMYKERPLELSMEGHAIRFMDLRRWGILKERFEKLSKQPFTTWGIPYVKLKKDASYLKPATCWGWAFDYNLSTLSYTTGNTGANYQYEQAAINYSDDKAYYPIPSDETISNPEVVRVLE